MLYRHASTRTFKTRLHSFPEASFRFKTVVSAQSKKEARKEISIAKTSETLGFLHSALISINGDNYLLAGPSGIGKSTYSGSLEAQLGASLLVNDWVAVEKEGQNFYASGLDFAENLHHSERCLLSGIIFLTYNDEIKRDAFAPNKLEFRKLLSETFDTASDSELDRLSSFWLQNYLQLPFLCAVPARRGPKSVITRTLVGLLNRQKARHQPIEVGVIGLGSIGTELAFQLGQLPYIHKVHLYTLSQDKTIGYAIDMNHALINRGYNIFEVHRKPEDLFASSSSVFLTFRDRSDIQGVKNLPERWQRLSGNLKILNDYAQIIGAIKFDGTIFVITNPVDILTYALYQGTLNKNNALRTYQVYGCGLEVDVARALYYGKQIDPNLTYNSIRVYGNHSDMIVLKTPLSDLDNSRLLEVVSNASTEIRRFVPRTIFGPVGAVVRTFQAFQRDGRAHVTLIQQEAFIGRVIDFRNQLPMISEEIFDGEYQTIIEHNREVIATYLR